MCVCLGFGLVFFKDLLFKNWFGLVYVAKWHLVSVRTFSVMYDHAFSKLANHQIRHQAAHKVGCQPGDRTWSLFSSSGFRVGIYGLTYSLYSPWGSIQEL